MKINDISKMFRWFIYIGIFSLILLPFYVSDVLYFPYITSKAFVFRITTEIVFGIWLILAIFDPAYRPKKSLVSGSAIIFLLVVFVANWFGVNRLSSFASNFERMDGYITIAHLFALFFVMTSVLRTKLEWSIFFHATMLASVVSVIQAFSQIFEKGFNYRIDTTLGNPIYLAVYMLFNAFISLWLMSQIKSDSLMGYLRSKRFWLYLLMFVLQSVVLLQTGTRGAMIGLFVGGVCASLLVIIFGKNEKPARYLASIFIGILVVFTAVLFLFKDSSFVQNNQALQRITSISISGGTAQARLINWSIAWEGVKERPIFGWGQNNYSIVYDKYYNPKMLEQEPWFDRTHNIVFDWLIAAGFVGLLSYLSLLVLGLWLLWKIKENSIFEKSVLTGLFVGYFIHNMFVFDNLISYVFFIFVLAYIVSQNSKDIAWISKPLNVSVQYALIAIVLIFTPWIVYKLNYNGYVVAKEVVSATQLFVRNSDGKVFYQKSGGADENLEIYKKIINLDTFGSAEVRARLARSLEELLAMKNIPESSRMAFVDFTRNQLQEQILQSPGDARYPYLLAFSMYKAGDLALASESIRKAIEIAPKKQLMHLLAAQIYMAQGDKNSALQEAKTSYEVAPEFDVAWANYMIILGSIDKAAFTAETQNQIAQGNFSRVEKLVVNQINRQPDVLQNYVSLAALYYQQGNKDAALKVLEDTLVKFPSAKSALEQLKKQIESGLDPLGKNFK